jgi:hypothetical protein
MYEHEFVQNLKIELMQFCRLPSQLLAQHSHLNAARTSFDYLSYDAKRENFGLRLGFVTKSFRLATVATNRCATPTIHATTIHQNKSKNLENFND